MTSLVRGSLVITLAALLATVAPAEDKKPAKPDEKKPTKGEEKKPTKGKDPYAAQFAFPKQITLDEKQKEQVEKLRTEYGPKLAELAKKQNAAVPADRVKAANEARKKAYAAILTPERVKAANEAKQKAADDGKAGKELNKVYNEALKLTPDEQKQLKGLNKIYDEALNLTADEKKNIADINQERAALLKEINEKKMAILTDEQKEALKSKPKPKTSK